MELGTNSMFSSMGGGWVLLNDQILFYNPQNSTSDKEKLALSGDTRVLRLLHMEEVKAEAQGTTFYTFIKNRLQGLFASCQHSLCLHQNRL